MKNLFVIAMAALVLVGCSKNQRADEKPTHEPPSGSEAEVAMPKSPPLVRDGESAEETENDGAADAGEAEGEATNDDGTPSVTRSELETFLDKGPPYVLTVVTFEPVHREGKFQGFQITDVTRGAREFMTPQLRVGDIVTHVNGVRILKPDDLTQAWRSLNKADSIRVDYIRQSDTSHALWVVK